MLPLMPHPRYSREFLVYTFERAWLALHEQYPDASPELLFPDALLQTVRDAQASSCAPLRYAANPEGSQAALDAVRVKLDEL